MIYVYILELKRGKYYVGKSKNPDKRIKDHFDGKGAAWTKKYKPIRVVEKISDCTNYHEDMYTKMYMDTYGIDNVRGGSYVTVTLDPQTIKHLEATSISSTDKCFACKKSGHFIKDCPSKRVCERCGRDSHDKSRCYAKKHIDGSVILKDTEKIVELSGDDENSEELNDENSDELIEDDENSDTIIDISYSTIDQFDNDFRNGLLGSHQTINSEFNDNYIFTKLAIMVTTVFVLVVVLTLSLTLS